MLVNQSTWIYLFDSMFGKKFQKIFSQMVVSLIAIYHGRIRTNITLNKSNSSTSRVLTRSFTQILWSPLLPPPLPHVSPDLRFFFPKKQANKLKNPRKLLNLQPWRGKMTIQAAHEKFITIRTSQLSPSNDVG